MAIYSILKQEKKKKDKSDKDVPFRLRTLSIPGTLDQGKHWLMFQYHIYKINRKFYRCFAIVNNIATQEELRGQIPGPSQQ